MGEHERKDEPSLDEKAQGGAEQLTREVEEKGVLGAIKDDFTPGSDEDKKK